MSEPEDLQSVPDGREIPEVIVYPENVRVIVQNVGPKGEKPGREKRVSKNRSYYWAVGLFIATCLSTWYVGQMRYDNGFGYMIPVMTILFAHEMGHYLTSLYYRVSVSPPFFLPMPFTPLGTFGAVITRRAGQEDRKMLFDIAIAGPLAGLVIAIPVCIYGAIVAVEIPFNEIPRNDFQFIAPPFVGWLVTVVRGPWPAGAVLESPILDAGWVGIFITALNLIPIGQLDGGHILYTLIGKKAHHVANGLIAGSAIYMILTQNPTFLLMLFLIVMMGPYHPPTAIDQAKLGWFRVLLGWGTLAFITVGFTFTPMVIR